jgi:peptide deformylase
VVAFTQYNPDAAVCFWFFIYVVPQKAAEVPLPATAAVKHSEAVLHAALRRFRAQHGFGRAIAAPQIGFSLRMIAVNLGSDPFTMINPVITHKSGV